MTAAQHGCQRPWQFDLIVAKPLPDRNAGHEVPIEGIRSMRMRSRLFRHFMLFPAALLLGVSAEVAAQESQMDVKVMVVAVPVVVTG